MSSAMGEKCADVVEVDVVAEAVSQVDSSSVDHGENGSRGEIGAEWEVGKVGMSISEGDRGCAGSGMTDESGTETTGAAALGMLPGARVK